MELLYFRRTAGHALAVACMICVAGHVAGQTTQPRPSPASADEAVVLSAFTVSSEKDSGYESMQTTSGLRTVQELKNVANSITVVNQQLIQDVGALTIEDMTKWTITGEANPDPTVVSGSSRLIFRGVQNNYGIRNGWIWYSPVDSYSTERLELLRGPNAFLYGESDVGGAQNQITKRGLFTRNFARTRVVAGSYDLRRAELDINRRVSDQLALRFAAVQSNNHTWWDHGRRDFRGVYGAATYRPSRNTTVTLIGEYAKSTEVRSTGLLSDAYSYSTTGTYANNSGFVFVPAAKSFYRLAGRVSSRGSNAAVVDEAIVPREFQFNGPNATNRSDQKSMQVEIEQALGRNLHVLFSANYYSSSGYIWGITNRSISRDLNRLLPDGSTNPYYNELYMEYQRTRQSLGNEVRDVRLSGVYDLDLHWMKQQIVLNLQQHQDNPGQKYPKLAEYLATTNPAFVGTLDPAHTVAAFTANRATLANNKFVRRFYLRDGDRAELTGDVGPVTGLSDYFPDLGSNAAGSVGATGAIIDRRFYTPSIGVGASGTYFNGHLYTLLGYRRDEFKMKTLYGVPRALPNTWVVDQVPGTFSGPEYQKYRFDGSNVGGVLRVNDTLAFTYNYARTYRLSLGDGNNGFLVGTKQGIPRGEGSEGGVRLTLLGGRVEMNATYFNDYQPNSRVALASAYAPVRTELAALFPQTFDTNGTDVQRLTTKGTETEIVANLTPHWRLMMNLQTNKMVTEDRYPQLRAFQNEAHAQNKATPQLDSFLLTVPEGLPTAGYTKLRANLFTRYEFMHGLLRGVYVGGGCNWRDRTFRGNFDGNGDGTVEDVWGPSYTTFTLLAGYQTRVGKGKMSVAANVDNVFDKVYYRSAATGTGSWGDPRTFKLSLMFEF